MSSCSLYDWCRRCAELLQAKTTAKPMADELVEQALFKHVTGFFWPAHLCTLDIDSDEESDAFQGVEPADLR